MSHLGFRKDPESQGEEDFIADTASAEINDK
jgi:hypothetical protein